MPSLASDLSSSDPTTREAAVQNLVCMGKVAAPARKSLVDVVKKCLPEKTTFFALEALQNIGDYSQEVLDALSEAAHSPDPDIRRRARYVHYSLSRERRDWDS